MENQEIVTNSVETAIEAANECDSAEGKVAIVVEFILGALVVDGAFHVVKSVVTKGPQLVKKAKEDFASRRMKSEAKKELKKKGLKDS